MILLPPSSTLFPYTTLFRSSSEYLGSWITCSGWSSSTGLTSMLDSATSCFSACLLGSVSLCFSTVGAGARSEEHTSELQSHVNLVCRLLLEKNKNILHELIR